MHLLYGFDQIPQTLLLNPGTVGGVGQARATWMLGDLATLTFELRELDKALERRPLPMTGT